MIEQIDLGGGRVLTWKAFEGNPYSACNITHTQPNGKPCNHHYCPIKGGAWARGFTDEIAQWELKQIDPVTLWPSILCLGCGDHGYVTAGKWVKA